MISDTKLDFWIKNNYNVIMEGRHGVGKTMKTIAAFERNGLRWLYFSAATMDPWVDFIGVPKERLEGSFAYLDLVRPRFIEEDAVDAIFFDEYNRSPAKVRDAVMELIQFKSINGKRLKNLKIVWAAINPHTEDAEYEVEKIDPAQMDRFHVQIQVPYVLDIPYLKAKYPKINIDSVVSWWNELPEKERFKVSPRRVDYALDMHSKEGDLADVLPKSANITKLRTYLSIGTTEDYLKQLYTKRVDSTTRREIRRIDFFRVALPYIEANQRYIEYFIPFCTREAQVIALLEAPNVRAHVMSRFAEDADLRKMLLMFYRANADMLLEKPQKPQKPPLQKSAKAAMQRRELKRELLKEIAMRFARLGFSKYASNILRVQVPLIPILISPKDSDKALAKLSAKPNMRVLVKDVSDFERQLLACLVAPKDMTLERATSILRVLDRAINDSAETVGKQLTKIYRVDLLRVLLEAGSAYMWYRYLELNNWKATTRDFRQQFPTLMRQLKRNKTLDEALTPMFLTAIMAEAMLRNQAQLKAA
jgi:hypothetical protein